MRDVTVTGGMTSVGTDANEFDALMKSLSAEDNIALHLNGLLKTRGEYRWGKYAGSNWRAGKNWTIDGDAELVLEPDFTKMDSEPLFVLAWHPDSVAPMCRGITLNAQHSKLAGRWHEAGLMLRTGAVLQYGAGLIEEVTYRDVGALRAPNQPKDVSSETFVAEIVGSGTIHNCVMTDYVASTSNDQVSVNRVMGSENGEVVTDKLCLLEGNRAEVSGDNMVQLCTVYWTTQGLVRKNVARGALVGYYADWGTSKVRLEENDFEVLGHGVHIQLSPGQPFHHEIEVGINRIKSGAANVSLNCVSPPTADRYIRASVDRNLYVENISGWAEVTRTGADLSKRGGCLSRIGL